MFISVDCDSRKQKLSYFQQIKLFSGNSAKVNGVAPVRKENKDESVKKEVNGNAAL